MSCPTGGGSPSQPRTTQAWGTAAGQGQGAPPQIRAKIHGINQGCSRLLARSNGKSLIYFSHFITVFSLVVFIYCPISLANCPVCSCNFIFKQRYEDQYYISNPIKKFNRHPLWQHGRGMCTHALMLDTEPRGDIGPRVGKRHQQERL